MKILFAAAECAPFFKTGGLGDVAGALPKNLQKKGAEVRVVLPLFTKMAQKFQDQLEDVCQFTVHVGWRKQYCGVKTLRLDGIHYYFIDNRYYFDRPELYGYYDDGERFAFFQMALVEMLEKIGFIPDILHVNDYHTSFVPCLLKEKYHWIQAYNQIRTVFTIHNIEFQGKYSPEILADLFGMGGERYEDGTIRFEDNVNFMKAGILYADRVNTVSPSYAAEIQTPEFGDGLDVILRMESGKLSGILNGIDYDTNDPETDPALVENYSLQTVAKKAANKTALQKRLGLPINEDVALIGVVSRLTYQKGFHLLVAELENLLQFDVQFVLLGTGDPRFEEAFSMIGHRYPGKCSINIDFDIQLAQQIYASCDLFLMPSAFEPCGLSQMMAMRYGTLPIVHEIGGLKDTVEPYNPLTNAGTGFGFDHFTSFYMMEAIKLALAVYYKQKPAWSQLIQQAMTKDFSWETASEHYLALYHQIIY